MIDASRAVHRLPAEIERRWGSAEKERERRRAVWRRRGMWFAIALMSWFLIFILTR